METETEYWTLIDDLYPKHKLTTPDKCWWDESLYFAKQINRSRQHQMDYLLGSMGIPSHLFKGEDR